jgi:hypothetical protein
MDDAVGYLDSWEATPTGSRTFRSFLERDRAPSGRSGTDRRPQTEPLRPRVVVFGADEQRSRPCQVSGTQPSGSSWREPRERRRPSGFPGGPLQDPLARHHRCADVPFDLEDGLLRFVGAGNAVLASDGAGVTGICHVEGGYARPDLPRSDRSWRDDNVRRSAPEWLSPVVLSPLGPRTQGRNWSTAMSSVSDHDQPTTTPAIMIERHAGESCSRLQMKKQAPTSAAL